MAATGRNAEGVNAPGFATRVDRLRRKLEAWGWSRDEIAAALRTEFRLRPRAAYRYAAGLSGQQAADAYNLQHGDARHPAPMSKSRVSEYENWPLGRNTRKPSCAVLDNLADLYGTTRRRLLDHHDYEALSPAEGRLLDSGPPMSLETPTAISVATVAERLDLGLPRPGAASMPVAWVLPGEGPPPYAERQLVMAAANQAGEHAGKAGAGNLEEVTLDQLHDHVVRLARAYLTGPMMPVFSELVAVRNRTYDLLERTQRLEQRHDLYLIAGLLSCLLAGTSYDLGYPEAGIEQARAAQIYGELIGHESLRAYAYGQLATFFHLEGQYRRALDYARAGQAHATAGSPMLRLRSLQALASSRLGRAEETTTALEAARRARGEVTGTDDLHDRTGGMFTSTDAKQAYMAGMTYIHLGQADKAAQEAGRAIDLWTTGPAEERAEGALAVARIDLLTAFLLLGELDAAIDSATPLLAVAPEQRTTIVLKRLSGFQDQLARPPYAGSPQVESLGQRIEDFRATATTAELPPRPP